jgi:cardiolipin synthase
MDHARSEEADTAGLAPPPTAGLVTIPNILCLIRLLGSGVLVWLAVAEQPSAFVWLYLFLAMTDWVDGKLAIMLNQRSVFGARLDSWADAALYTSLLFGACWLHGDALRHESIWMAAALTSYAASTLFGIWKFGRWPSYHTRLAKTSWLLITFAAIFAMTGWSMWPLRITMVIVTLTNLEAMLITHRLQRWEADILSIFHARSENGVRSQ